MVGPMAAGKTTLSRALSVAVGVPYAPLDWVGFHAMVRDGLDVRAYEAQSSWEARHRLRMPHLIAAAEAAVRDFPGFLLDYGAGFAHFDDPEHAARLRAVLDPLPNVIHVTTSLDPDEAAARCLARDRARWEAAGHACDASRESWHRTYAHSPCYPAVAKHTVVTHDRSVEDCVEEIIKLLG